FRIPSRAFSSMTFPTAFPIVRFAGRFSDFGRKKSQFGAWLARTPFRQLSLRKPSLLAVFLGFIRFVLLTKRLAFFTSRLEMVWQPLTVGVAKAPNIIRTSGSDRSHSRLLQ